MERIAFVIKFILMYQLMVYMNLGFVFMRFICGLYLSVVSNLIAFVKVMKSGSIVREGIGRNWSI